MKAKNKRPDIKERVEDYHSFMNSMRPDIESDFIFRGYKNGGKYYSLLSENTMINKIIY